MVKFILSVYFLTLGLDAYAQNLVLNSGFEEFKIGPPPSGFSHRSEDFKLPGWNSPTSGTPDYFRGNGEGGVPANWAGYSKAREGKSYAGIMSGSCNPKGKNFYREYLQGTLTNPLQRDRLYEGHLYFKLSSKSGCHCQKGQPGIVFVKSSLRINNDHNLPYEPVPANIIEGGQDGWSKLTFTYLAKGEEQFIVIGNFSDNTSSECMIIDYRSGGGQLSGTVYYYIDNINLQAHAQNSVTQNEISLGGDSVVLKKYYSLKNLQFEFDSFELVDSTLNELNRVADLLNENGDWNVEVYGYCDDRGTKEYNLILSQKRAEEVSLYLEQKGINRQRISPIGKGSSKPISTMQNDQGWATNRRVEVRFVSPTQ